MASSNTDSPGTIYRWIERKPLTEAVSWTSKEKFWLTIAMCHYGTHDWKSVAQVLRHGGEPYRPREWFTPKSCERQFKILVSNLSKEAKLLPFLEMMQHIAEGLKSDYVREVNKSRDTLKLKYCNLFSILNRVKQGNLSRNEVVSLYSQARRNEIEGKQYMDQLMTRQNASLASENSNSGLIEEPIKWNTPSAPLLTSLLRSRNTIPANRTATTITSLLQSPGGTSRTRSGKLLTLTPSSRTSQGTPTLSKLLEAPANPYIPSPPQTTQKNKLSVAVVTEKLANTSRKENSQSISLNKVRVDNMTTLGSFNQINKSNLSASKKQISKSPVSAVKNGSKANLNVVNLLSDSENEEDKNTCLKSSFGDKKDTTSRVEPRATRSQTRAEGGFKQFNDTKLSDGKKERENLRQQSGGSQIIETHLIDDDIADIDHIEVEPLSSIQDEVQTQTSSKMIGSSLQKPSLSSAEDNLSTNNKVNISKETINEISEETSISLILTPKNKNFIPDHHCLIGNPLEEILSSELLIDADNSSVKSVVKLRKDSMSLPNTLATSDEKLLKQQGVIELKATNIRCVDNRSDSKMSYNNQPIVVVNKIKKPFNIKLTSEQRVEDIQVTNADVKKPMRLNNSSQNVVEVIENNSTVTATDDDDDDAVIIVEDNININDNNKTTMKTNELSSNIESQNLSSIVVSPNISCNSRSSVLELDEKKNKNDKTSWNVFGKPQNSLDSTKKQCHQDSIAKGRINSNISETNNKCIKELDFDFDQSISQTSLAELYNGVEEIVEMHSFDNEELNSLIECGSLDSNETEEHRNTVSIDQGDSSVSESDSTIGAFDTFAQITRVRQKSSTSKEIKLDSRELKTTNQEIKHLKESFCQSNKIEDDQSSPASVTGIPVLQGVISDVMNQIDLNSVASLATSTSHIPPSNDVVEILSSDDEMNVKNFKARPLNEQNKPIGTQDKEKEEKSSTFKEAELVKLPEVESKMYKSNNTNCKISTIDEPIDIEMPPCIVVKSHNISVADRMKFDKILAIKTEIYQNEMEYDTIHDTVPDEIIVVNDEEEDKKPLGIAVKSAKERLIKETERMKREAEERKKKEEERIRKEDDERKKKEEDERKKKENDDRMKRENEERMKKEEELKKKELENILLNERKKKEDEDRKIKEDKERKKKEDEEKKIKALQETMRKEKEQQILQKIDEEERQKNITKEKLNEFHLRMKNDMNNMKDISLTLDKIVVVKEEIIDECVDDILEEIIDKDELEEDMILNDEYLDDIIGRINMSTISQKSRAMKNIFKRRSELAQIRDYELRWKEESIKSRIKLKECMQIQDLLNKREKLKLSAGDVSAQKGYTRIQPQTMINILELQNREAKEVDNQRYKEIDVKKIMEAERQRAYEIISKEAEMKRVKSAELERIKNEKIKRAEEVETKKSKEVELRKNIIVKETEIKGLEKKSVLKKMNEPENNRSAGHTDFKLMQNYAIILPDILKQSAPRYHSNVGQKLSETRKATAKEDFETFNLRERGIKKSVGSEGKKIIESKLPEIKMVTRTRGLKAEEKLKETNVSKSMSTKLRPQIKPSGSTSSISSSTIAENLPISSYEYKKQTKNVDDGNKHNSSSNIPYDNKHLRDLNVDSSDIVRKENSNHDAIGTPRTRTRSSSFKQKPFSETKSSKQSQDNVTSIILKESIGTKAIFTAAHHFSKRHFFNKHLFNDDYDGQTLVPVVMLDKNEISLKASQKAMGYVLKQHQNTSTHNQVQKPIETIKQLEKPPPKKRGRKRRIDVQNEKLQESIRSNELTPKNFRKTRTSIKEVEPLAKRTRRSLGLLNTKKESGNKRQSVHSHKFKKEFVDKSVENIKTNKKVLKFVFNNICERSKYILSLNKETKDLPPKCLEILKFPVELQKIKRKITAGKITSIAELKFNLLILSHNVLMTKRSDSKVFSDASNFQSELEEYFRSLKNIVDDQNVRKCQDDSFYIHSNCYNKRRYPGSNYDPFDAHITINKKTIANIYKYIDNSSDESSGSESDSYMPPKNKRKKNVSDSSSSESD